MKIILTGKPGSGKSTLISKLIQEFQDKKIAGIITPEMKEGGHRTGFEIVDLKSGEKETMASVHFKTGPKVSKYTVRVDHIDKIVNRFREGFSEAEIIFLDEIGKMEYFSSTFKDTVDQIFNSDKTVVATVGSQLLNQFKEKGTVYFLERKGKDIFSEIKNRLKNS